MSATTGRLRTLLCLISSKDRPVVPFVDAAGRCLAVFIILKSSRGDAESPTATVNVILHAPPERRAARLSEAPWAYYYVVTNTGYNSTEVYESMMDTFTALWTLHHPGLACLLVCDQLECHRNPAIVARLCKSMIYVCLFAANTSHFLQPLDGHVFALFKRLFRLHIAEMTIMAAVDSELRTGLIFHAVYEALECSLTPKVITASWSSRGVVPFDRDLIMAAARSWACGLAANDLGPHRAIVNELVATSAAILERNAVAEAGRRTSLSVELPKAMALSTAQVLDLHQQQSAAKEAAKEAKRVAAIERAEKRKQREEEEEERRVRRTELEQERAERKKAEEEDKERRRCKAGCGRFKKKTAQWEGCECGSFLICISCMGAKGARLLASHKRKEGH